MNFANFDCPQYFDFDSFVRNVKDTSTSKKKRDSKHKQSISNSAKPSDVIGKCPEENLKLRKNIGTVQSLKFKVDDKLKKNYFCISTSQQKLKKLQYSSHCINSPVRTIKSTYSKNEAKKETCVSLAEKVNNYLKKTPERYKTLKKDTGYSTKLRPRTPKPTPSKKNQVLKNALKNEEMDQGKKINKYTHSDKPIQKKIPLKVTKTSSQASTKEKNNKMNILNKGHGENECENKYVFRARPVPKNMFIKPTGLGKKIVLANTIAKSPFFYSEKRLQKRKLQELMQEEKENPSKKTKFEEKNFPLTPKLQNPKCTRVQPFSFDKRKMVLIKESKEEAIKINNSIVFQDEFIPTFQSFMLLNASKNIPVEVPVLNLSFNKNVMRKSCMTAKKSTTFKAQPASVLKKQPFLPEKAPKQKMEFKEFKFSTNKRVTDRLEHKKEKEILSSKKDSLPQKSTPVKYTTKNKRLTTIVRNSKRCTIAISPKFETDKRLRCRESKYYGLV